MQPSAELIAKESATFCVATDHPALAGHFPGAPVVPGVLMLAEGLRQLELQAVMPVRFRKIESAKFLQPVAPGATVTANLTLTVDGHARVEFFVGKTLVAQVKFTSALADDRIHG